MNKKRFVNINTPRVQISYSEQAVLQLLRITPNQLRALKNSGKLTLSNLDGSIPGYSAEQVDKLMQSDAIASDQTG